jgi:hypothetical protein
VVSENKENENYTKKKKKTKKSRPIGLLEINYLSAWKRRILPPIFHANPMIRYSHSRISDNLRGEIGVRRHGFARWYVLDQCVKTI